MLDLAQLYVALYHALRPIGVVQLNDWAPAPWHVRQARRSRDEVISGTFSAPDFDGNPQLAFAVASGLHDALALADPAYDDTPAEPLVLYRDRLLATNNLLGDASAGALVPCRIYPTRPQGAPTTLAERLPNLRLVDAATWKLLGWQRLPRLSDVDEFGAPLRIASVPFLAAPEDVELARVDRKGGSYYTATPVTARLGVGVEAALDALDTSGAQIGLLPEVSCDTLLLCQWQEACRARRSTGQLRLLLIGTGPVVATVDGCLLASPDVRDPITPNRAVVLDRRTGDIVLAQDKQRGFAMDEAYRDRAGIGGLGSGTLNELLPDAPGLNVLESRAGRFAVLICEDLARLTDVGADVRAAAVSHALVPVFAPPIQAYRWQHTAAKALVDEGVSVIVVNGLTLGRHAQDGDGTDTPEPAVTMLALSSTGAGPRRAGSVKAQSRPRPGDPLPAGGADDALTARVVDL